LDQILAGAEHIPSTPEPVLEVAVGLVGLVFIIILHGVGIRFVNRRFNSTWIKVDAHTPIWRINVIFTAAIASLSMLHFIETMLWALPISHSGIIPNLRDAYYFVLDRYTTLGEDNVHLPTRWRLIGPIIAMSGLFTFGWTGSVLVSIMGELGRLDRARARAQDDKPDGQPTKQAPPGAGIGS
jgi:amino acid transporter